LRLGYARVLLHGRTVSTKDHCLQKENGRLNQECNRSDPLRLAEKFDKRPHRCGHAEILAYLSRLTASCLPSSVFAVVAISSPSENAPRVRARSDPPFYVLFRKRTLRRHSQRRERILLLLALLAPECRTLLQSSNAVRNRQCASCISLPFNLPLLSRKHIGSLNLDASYFEKT
jgi:hypothetical protein